MRRLYKENKNEVYSFIRKKKKLFNIGLYLNRD